MASVAPVLTEFGSYLLTAWTSSCSLNQFADYSWPSYLWNSFVFILFGSCPQRVLVSTVHLIFLGVVLVFAASKFLRQSQTKLSAVSRSSLLNGRERARRPYVSSLFKITLVVLLVMAVLHTCVAIWRIGYGFYYGWRGIPAQELVYSLSLALAWITFLTITGHERKFESTRHPPVLRAWWGVTCFLYLLTLCSAISRFLGHDPRTLQLWVDDVVTVISTPVAVFLLAVAVLGVTGVATDGSFLREPLLGEREENGHRSPVEASEPEPSKFAAANFFSKLTWYWLGSLLTKGVSKALDPSDVPLLAPSDQAEAVYSKFKVNYDSESGRKSCRKAVLMTYWPQLLFTALLALIKLSVMYVGPLLINPISDYVAGKELFPFEGYVLFLILLLAKVIEVLAAHHYNFFSNKLGMVIRSSLITAVYRKGLKITNSARQTHGAGQITNYMIVDVQMIADCLVQLHNMWILPLQILAALVILFGVVGISSAGGTATMLLCVTVSFAIVNYMRRFQVMVMKSKDKRMAATTEVLNNMKIIKLQSWEDHFKSKIESLRDAEWGWLRKFFYTLSVNIVILFQSPILVAIATFGLCVLLQEQLTPARVFTALSTFRIMQVPLQMFPTALMNISQALASFERLDKFLESEELDETVVERVFHGGSEIAVEMDSGVFKWDSEAKSPSLTNIDFTVKRGSLVAIVGTVGSGKSSLLSAILGEVPKVAGKVKVSGTTSFVAQEAWIQNATIQDNILFGKAMDEIRYQETLRACALEEDLAQMDFGDQTEIGERGLNLSGGQKQRIQLARAVYQDTDIYLLDDVFSAVDAHTGSALFDGCIKGALGKKTVLLVTHQVEFLDGADLVLVMKDGHIVQSGKYSDLLESGTELNNLVVAHEEALGKVETVEAPAEDRDGQSSSNLSRESASLARPRSATKDIIASSAKKGTASLVQTEQRESGNVGWKLYLVYATKAFRGIPFLIILVAQSCFQITQVASDYYLAGATSVDNQANFRPGRFISIYAEFGLGTAAFLLTRTFVLAFWSLQTSQAFFRSMLSRIFKAPMSFFDTTPTGRILTRFSNDQTSVDLMLPIGIGAALGSVTQTLGILFVVCQVTKQLTFIVIPLAFLFRYFQRYYISTSRELTRIDSVTKAPIVHHFSETIAGFVTIRAFKEQTRFMNENVDKVNNNLKMDFHINSSNEWLGFRLEMIATAILSISALFMIMFRDYLNADLVGLSLSYGLALNACLYNMVFLGCQVENKMVSAERINQYCHIDSEPAAIIPENRPPAAWPQTGNLHFQRLELRYRKDTPLVLKGISLYIRDGEKIGVVGRTGSGKSTLIQALFRLVDPAAGSVIIDGLDITTIGLRDLRSKFGIIPQEPTLFHGTVRFNLDPLGEHSDAEIWEGLEKCQLADLIRAKVEKLDAIVQERGENWSVGQRQLFCLGRALLKRSRILVLDEATASVDAQTDAIIQASIRTEFQFSTVISIAHRVPSVMDSDKVLVLDSGHVKEFDSPSRLLDQRSSLFAALVREYKTRSGNAHN